MATINNRTLDLTHDHTTKTVRAVAKCKVKFDALDMFQMTGAPQGSFFKLKCKLRSAVGGFLDIGEDDLFTYSNFFSFPDATSAASEDRTFDVRLGEGVLDEDIGTDEVYAQFMLVNMSSGTVVKKNSNTVSHEFNPS